MKCASTSALITHTQASTDILFCDKTRVLMFYFDSKTARPIVPLKWAALVFRKLILTGCCLVKRTVKVISTDPYING